MKEVVRLALVGLGDHMFRILYPFMVGLPVKLVAACDIQEARTHRFSEFYTVPAIYADYRKMIRNEKLDALVCCCNAQVHYEVAKECMNYGISPFVEKTPCTTGKQALELMALEQETGCFTMVGFNRRFTTAYQMACDLIRQREFGRPWLYLAKYNSSAYASDDYFLLNHVVHHLDLARYLLGEIDDIWADKIQLDGHRVGYHIGFTTREGALGCIQSSSLQFEPFPMERVEITGCERNIIVDNVKHVEYNRPAASKLDRTPELREGQDALCWNHNHGHSALYSHYGFERELKCYIDAIMKETVPPATFKEIAGTMVLYDQMKAHISCGTGSLQRSHADA